jgi:hypothetical protein
MKIIALRPLAGSSYLKILAAGQTYFLSSNYTIDSKEKITEKSGFPLDFFSSEKVQLNVQAIVGKNGSGKSSLIELLFRAVNNIAFQYQKLKVANLVKIQGLRVDIYYKTDTFYKVKIFDDKISFFKYDKRNGSITVPVNDKDIDLKDFFYSIVVNYSHYAYNDPDFKESKWIEGLFHKNDGYRTPLVFNPHRTKGNIDINSENHLVKSRLISNLLMTENSSHYSKINNNLSASHLVLTAYKENKRNKTLYTKSKTKPQKFITYNDLNINEEYLLARLDKFYRFDLKKLDRVKYLSALNYILYKLVSIALKYYNHEEIYFSIIDDAFDDSKLDEFFIKLHTDESHVTLKLRQTINFLKYQHIDLQNQTLSLDKLRKDISAILQKNKNSKRKLSHIDLIPPPIFNTEILMSTENDKNATIPFTTLSSGEKQLVYAVSSVLYHILNLESVPSNTKKRTAYRYINVVLEEIEMYAHPEMQRTYIKYLIESIERLSLRRTLDINIIFITHSPFILSDIPESNILFLNELGMPEPMSESLKTFGGNIHDLLTASFFLKQGAIGAFALNKINNIIKLLNESSSGTITDTKKEELFHNINFVAEPFLRNKLLDMYYIKFGKQKRIEQLEAELKKLKSNG